MLLIAFATTSRRPSDPSKDVWFRPLDDILLPELVNFCGTASNVQTDPEMFLEVMRVMAQVGDLFLVDFWPDWITKEFLPATVVFALETLEER